MEKKTGIINCVIFLSLAFCFAAPAVVTASDTDQAKKLMAEKPLPLPLPATLPAEAKAVEESEVAMVKTFSGKVAITRLEKVITVKKDEKIYVGDTLQTGGDGTIGITFKDNSTLSLGHNSTVIIQSFLFSPAYGKLSMVNRLVKGTAAFISGVIAKLSPQSVHFETPVATVGFRGTTILVRIEDETK